MFALRFLTIVFTIYIASASFSEFVAPNRQASKIGEMFFPLIGVANAQANDLDRAAYQRWLRQRQRRQEQNAQTVLDIEEQARTNGDDSLTAEQLTIRQTARDEFSRQRRERYQRYLRQRGRTDPQAAQVLEFLETGLSPLPAKELADLRRQMVADFRRGRLRESNFNTWIRERAATENDARIVRDDMDGRAIEVNQGEVRALRQSLLRRYTERLNARYSDYFAARDNLEDLLQQRITAIAQQQLPIQLVGVTPAAPVYNNDDITAALDRIDTRRAQIEADFGWFGPNPLFRDAKIFDDAGLLLPIQGDDKLCGLQCTRAFVTHNGETFGVDDILLEYPTDTIEGGSVAVHRRDILIRRGLNAQILELNDLEVADNVGDAPPNPLDQRIRAIRQARQASGQPVIVSIGEDDRLRRKLEAINEIELRDIARTMIADPNNGLMQDDMMARLRKLASDGSLTHAIVVDDLRQLAGMQQAVIRDPDAEFMYAPIHSLARAARIDIVYIAPGPAPAPTAPDPLDWAVELDPPSSDEE